MTTYFLVTGGEAHLSVCLRLSKNYRFSGSLSIETTLSIEC